MKSAWPTSSETSTRLTSYGLTLPTGYTAQNAIDDAVAKWEYLCGFSPFLAGSSNTYVHDPCDSEIVRLRAPFGQITSVEVDGEAVTIGDDVFLMPGSVVNEPYQFLQFGWTVYGNPGTIEVTGKLGWLQIPDAVWNAVLEFACGVVQRRTSGVAGEVQSIKQESVQIEFRGGVTMGSSLYAQTMEQLTALATRYRV